jgi:alpha-galactosidase
LDEIKDWVNVNQWIYGESGGYLAHIQRDRDEVTYDLDKFMREDPWVYSEENICEEHCAHIIRGLELGVLYRGHFNVVNNGIISNLPDDAIVEVPGYIDANGINLPMVGDLPLGCAAVCNASISVQRLAVEAAVHGDINLLRQAFMMDPLVGAVCNPPEIWQMVDEMLVAEAEWLPQYKEEIEKAKERLADKSNWIPVKEGAIGAALGPEQSAALLGK